MSVKRLVPLNTVGLTADPASAIVGDIYYNSTSKELRVYDGTSWQKVIVDTPSQTLYNKLISTTATNTIPLVVQGIASQTANLQEWQTSAGVKRTVIKAPTGNDGGLPQLFSTDGTTSIVNFENGGAAIATNWQLYSSQSILQFVSDRLRVMPRNAGFVGLAIQGAVGQTANLQEWQNSAGTALTTINASGDITTATYNGRFFVPNSGGSGAYLDTVVVNKTFSLIQRDTASVNLIIKAVASQTANLQEWQDSSGNVLTRVDASGNMLLVNPTANNNSVGTPSPTLNFQANTWNSSSGNVAMKGFIRLAAYLANSNPTISKMSFGLASDNGNPTEIASFTSSGMLFNEGGLDAAGTSVVFKLRNTTAATSGTGQASPKLELYGRGWNSGQGNIEARSYIQTGISNNNSSPFATRIGLFPQTGDNAQTSYEVISALSTQRAGINSTAPGAALQITSSVSTDIGLIVKGAASQTADLQQWQNSSGTALSLIDSSGRIVTGRTTQIGSSQLTVQGNVSVYSSDNTSALQSRILFLRGNSGGNLLALTSKGDAANGVAALVITNGAYTAEIFGFGYNGNIYNNIQSASTIGLTIKGATSQSANLQEWQNNSGTVLANIDANGNFTAQSLATNQNIVFEGSTADVNETTLTVDNPTADRTITLPDYSLVVGRDSISRVFNAEATTLVKGEFVYIFGAQGNNISVKRADNNADATSAKTFGIVANDIASGAEGFVLRSGLFTNYNTSAYVEGTAIWLGSTPGTFTITKPVAPNHSVYLGVIVRSHATVGEIYIQVQNGYELEELHNVLITSPANNDILAYESSTGLWKNINDPVFDNVTVSGNLTVNGTTTTVNTQDLVVNDPLIYIGEDNQANSVDLGLVASFNNGTYQHTGLVRDATDGKWKLFQSVTDEPTTIVNFAQATYSTLKAGTFEGNLTGNADTVTNGVYTTGSYSNPSWLTTLAWSKITSTPTTVSGYGITDSIAYTNVANTFTVGPQTIQPGADANKGLVIRANSTNQTGNLLEFQDGSGSLATRIDKDSNLVLSASASMGWGTTSAFSRNSSTGLITFTVQNVSTAGLLILNQNAAAIPFTIRGAASQSTSFFEIQNSAGAFFAGVDSGGNFQTAAGLRLANGTVTHTAANLYTSLISFGGTPTTEPSTAVRQRNTTQTGDIVQYQNSSSVVMGGANVRAQTYTGSTAPIIALTGGATTAASGDGTTATITTTSAHGLAVGDIVTIAGVTPTGYNGTYLVTAVPSTTQISYANTTTGAQTVAGTVSAPAQTSITARSAGTVGLAIRTAASGTNALVIQDSSGNNKLLISRDGAITTGSSGNEASAFLSGIIIGAGNIYARSVPAPWLSFSSGAASFVAQAATQTFVVKGAASQTADLQQWQNSAGTVLALVTPNGHLGVGQNGVSGRIYNTDNYHALVLRGTVTNAAGSISAIDVMEFVEYGAVWNFRKVTGTVNTLIASITETTSTFNSSGVFQPSSNIVGLIVKGTASQTANLQEWQDSTGTVLSHITSNGRLRLWTTAEHFSSLSTVAYTSGAHAFRAFGHGSGTTSVARIQAGTAAQVSLQVEGFASQTADLQQWLLSNGTVLSSISSLGAYIAPAATTSTASIRLPHGTAPTSPTDGDVWTTTAGIYVRVNGATVGPLASSAGSLTNPMTAIGDTIYGGASGTPARLAGNTSATPSFLGQTGDGTNSAAPSWTSSTGTGNVVLATAPSLTGTVTIASPNDSTVGIVVKQNSGTQTAKLIDFTNAAGTTLGAYVDYRGDVFSRANFLASNTYVALGASGAETVYLGASLNRSTGGVVLNRSIVPPNAGSAGVIVRGAASQTANLQEWQDSAGTVLANINASGDLAAAGLFTGGGARVGSTVLSIGRLSVTTATSSQVVVGIRGASGQTANLQEWQDSTGAVLASISAAGAFTIPSLIVSGDFTVNGTTTNLNTTNLLVEDKNITIADVATPTDTTADGAGITIKGATDKTFNWVQSTGALTSSEPISAPAFRSALSSSITANTATTVDTVAMTGFTTIEYTVSIKQGTKIRSSKVLVQTDGTTVDSTEYGIVETGGTISGVAVTASVSSTNSILTVTITDAATTNATVKLVKILL